MSQVYLEKYKGVRGHYKDLDLHSNPRSKMSSFGIMCLCSQEECGKQICTDSHFIRYRREKGMQHFENTELEPVLRTSRKKMHDSRKIMSRKVPSEKRNEPPDYY